MQPIFDVTHASPLTQKTDLSGRDRITEGQDQFKNAFNNERKKTVETPNSQSQHVDPADKGEPTTKPNSHDNRNPVVVETSSVAEPLADAEPSSLSSTLLETIPADAQTQLSQTNNAIETVLAPPVAITVNTINYSDTSVLTAAEEPTDNVLLAETLGIEPELVDVKEGSLDAAAAIINGPVVLPQNAQQAGNGTTTPDALDGRGRAFNTLQFTAVPVAGSQRGVIATEQVNDTVEGQSNLTAAKQFSSSGFTLTSALTSQRNSKTVVSDKMMFETAMLGQADLSTDAKGEHLETFAQLAHSHHSALSSQGVAPGARMQMPVNISFGKPEWAGMVAERATMMAAQNITSADLQLDPPELGPLQVRVQVNHDQVTVSFISANANVRDALDQTAMRLRDLCDQQGMNLVDVDVSDHPRQDAESEQENPTSSATGTLGLDGESVATDHESISLQANGGIDSYA